MSIISPIFPGELASPEELWRLAEEYRKAAEMLRLSGRKRQPMSRAPFRLAAIQALELYLNALLLNQGHPPSRIRAMQHNLGQRAAHAMEAGLAFRRKTLEHLHKLSESREYLVTRYSPELVSTASQLNRLEATLSEVATKVTVRLKPN